MRTKPQPPPLDHARLALNRAEAANEGADREGQSRRGASQAMGAVRHRRWRGCWAMSFEFCFG
jgi:hypothetical protein